MTCESWNWYWILTRLCLLVETGWPIYSWRRLWRISAIYNNKVYYFLWSWRRTKVERGTTEFSWFTHLEKFSELEEYFLWHHFENFEKLEDALESDISSRAATSFRHGVWGCEWAGEWLVLMGLYNIFYIFDIEGMAKFILDVNFCMSVKLDEWHVERGCESLLPLRVELSIGATCIHWAFIKVEELAEGICIRLERSWYSFMGGKATELDFGCYPWLQRLYIAREFIWISV